MEKKKLNERKAWLILWSQQQILLLSQSVRWPFMKCVQLAGSDWCSLQAYHDHKAMNNGNMM